MTNNRSSPYFLAFQVLAVIIVLYGAHLRFATVAQTFVLNPVRADAADYFNYAENLATKGIYSKSVTGEPDAVRAPGFPAFASIFYTQGEIQPTIIAQTVLQIIVFLVLTLSLYQHLSKPAYLFFLLMLWTFPHWISMNVYFLSESLFISLLALFIVIAAKPTLKTYDWLLLGFCLALMSLTKFTTEYFAFFIALILLYQKKVSYKHISLFILAALLPMIAWKIRNYVQIGSLSDPTLTINGLYHGSFVDFMYNNDPQTQGFAYRFDPDAAQYTSTTKTISLIFERFINSPAEYLTWYFYGKQTFLWRWNILAGMGDIWIYPVNYTAWYELLDMQITHFLHKSFHVIWIPLGLFISVIIFFKREKSILLAICSSLVVYCILIHAITAPYPRYGIPFKLPLLIACIIALDQFVKYQWQRLRK